MRLLKLHLTSIITVCMILAACGGSTLKKTFDNPVYTDSSYSNILIIGIAGDYDNRATFERTMVSRIKAAGAMATAYYTVVGRNQPIDRNTISTAVKSRGFDAVLLTRVISQATDVSAQDGTSETKVSRKEVSRAIDLFRYDYDELSEPSTINISSTVTLSAEMFSGPDEARMWAIESTISDKESVGRLIESAADTIMRQLKKDRLIGRYRKDPI